MFMELVVNFFQFIQAELIRYNIIYIYIYIYIFCNSNFLSYLIPFFCQLRHNQEENRERKIKETG